MNALGRLVILGTSHANALVRSAILCLTAAQLFGVYGPNAVGYVNTTLLPGFNLVANPLLNRGFTVADLTLGMGEIPDGLRVCFFSPDGYRSAVYAASSGRFEPSDVAAEPLTPGRGFFIYNPGMSLTVTFVGEVMQGKLTNALPAGFSIVASMVPQAGPLEVLAFPTEPGDVIYRFDPAAQKFMVSVFDDLEGTWLPSTPQIQVGEAFFVFKAQPALWTRTFSVIP